MSAIESGAALGASYRLVRRLGAGAAGEVWLAESLRGPETFAAKVLKAEHAHDPTIVERFVRERSVLLGLRHSNVVAVRDLVVEGETLAIVMDYVPGGSLRDILDARGTLRPAEALRAISQVFAGLAAAHAKQITHRDVKPDNVLLASGEILDGVQIADFGIAAVLDERNRTTTGLVGTPQYMAPELISQGQVTPAVDVYAAGILLYELLSGRTPFAGGGTDFTVAYRHVTVQPPRLELPDPLSTWLDRLLAKDPRERPTAAEASAQAEQLAAQFTDLPALDPAESPQEFEDVDRPQTVLRSNAAPGERAPQAYLSPLDAQLPELGEALNATVMRPMPQRVFATPEREPETEEPKRRWWQRISRKSWWFLAAAVVLLAVMIVGAVWIFSDRGEAEAEGSEAALTASQSDAPLPTGLTVNRVASYDPAQRTITVNYTYSAQKAPLAGDFLEVLPTVIANTEAADADGDDVADTATRPCPTVVWRDVTARTHSSSTGLDARCGWQIEAVDIPANGQVQFSATVKGVIANEAALDTWLTEAAKATRDALNDPNATSTAYPVQRIQSLNVTVPSRMVSQQTLPITVFPVWPHGADDLNPLYRSPVTGSPTTMLQHIAGDESGVRFSDSCGGAVAVSSDGLTVSTLSPTKDCRIHASIGNFTDLQSSAFSITTRE